MTAVSNAMPLIALDAVVIDSETTGLDPAKARLVEIAGVRLVAGRLDSGAPFRSLVRPDEPIPPSASAIHSIDDGMVADAPAFPEVWPRLQEFIGGAVVIGHALGFDLAVLRHECARSRIPWRRPRTLDTRLLAQVIEPDLAGFTLEQLAAWLGIEVEGRHSALGDAMTTARIFLAMLPKLRAGHIRTLAEAEQACRALTDVLDEQHRAGWIEPVEAPARADAERALRRIDSYPYRHRIRALMSAPPKFIAAQAPLREALAALMRERCSSLYVRAAGEEVAPLPAETGILTERDVLRAIAELGPDALALPVSRFMSRPLATVPAEAYAYRAIGRMSRMRIRHLGVTDEAGRVIGALSQRDLLRLRAQDAVALGDEIDDAADLHDLGHAWAKLPQVAAGLIAEGVGGRDIAGVISRELGALTRRAAILAEQRMSRDGHGAPPCPYALAVLGSAGRGESLLALDQDNALVFAEGAPDGPEDRWFAMLGGHVADILHEVGVPYCKGGVMAKNPQWRGSLATWRERIRQWIGRTAPQDLLSVDVFFDLRGVHGDGRLATTLWHDAFAAARGQAAFAKLLADSAGSTRPGLGLFGNFKTEQGRIDLKMTGLFGIVTAARVLAVCHHVLERATPARLAGIRALGLGADRDLEALDEAQATFLDLMIAQQVADIEQGRPATNSVAIKRLAARDRDRLRAALEAVRHVDAMTRDLLFRE